MTSKHKLAWAVPVGEVNVVCEQHTALGQVLGTVIPVGCTLQSRTQLFDFTNITRHVPVAVTTCILAAALGIQARL